MIFYREPPPLGLNPNPPFPHSLVSFLFLLPPLPLLAHRAAPISMATDAWMRSASRSVPERPCLDASPMLWSDSTVYNMGRGIQHGSSSLTSPLPDCTVQDLFFLHCALTLSLLSTVLCIPLLLPCHALSNRIVNFDSLGCGGNGKTPVVDLSAHRSCSIRPHKVSVFVFEQS